MKNKLEEKIKSIVQSNTFPKDASQLVYLFVQIRKYLEIKNNYEVEKYKKYTADEKILKLYSDWLLHNNLSFVLSQVTLSKFADDYDKVQSFSSSKNSHELIRCDNLRQSLNNLGKQIGVGDIFNSGKKWWSFLFVLVKELSDSPIENRKINCSFMFSNVQKYQYHYEFKYKDFSSSGGFILKLKPHAH